MADSPTTGDAHATGKACPNNAPAPAQAWRGVDGPSTLWGLDPDQFAALRTQLEPLAAVGGHVLFEQGDPADALHFIVSGSVGISVRDTTGLELRLARIGPPETVGEMALLSNGTRSARATILTGRIST